MLESEGGWEGETILGCSFILPASRCHAGYGQISEENCVDSHDDDAELVFGDEQAVSPTDRQ